MFTRTFTTTFSEAFPHTQHVGDYRTSSIRAGDMGTPLRQNCLEVGATACVKLVDAVEKENEGNAAALGNIVAFESRLSVLALTKISEC